MLPLSSLMGSNAAYGVIRGAQTASSLAFSGGGNTAALHSADKQNSLSMIQDSTMYKMQDTAYDSDKALQDKNIKRTFSYMA